MAAPLPFAARKLPAVWGFLLLLFFAVISTHPVEACPFCGSGQAETIGSRMLLNDLTVTAKVDKITTAVKDGAYYQQATYQVEKVLAAPTKQPAPAEFTGPAGTDLKPGSRCLLFASRFPPEGWQVLGCYSDQTGELSDYLLAYAALGEKPSVRDRLRFFAPRLETGHPIIREDVWNAFSYLRAEELKLNLDALHIDAVRRWLRDESIPLSRKALYAFLVGLAADKADAAVLRAILESFRKNCPPEASAFFTAYALADPQTGVEYLKSVLLDRAGDELFRTQSAFALRFLDGLLPREALRKEFRPVLVKLLDDPAFAADTVRLIRDWQDWGFLSELTPWYARRHEQLNKETRLEVIRLATQLPPGEGAALRNLVQQRDADLVKLWADWPAPTTSTAPAK